MNKETLTGSCDSKGLFKAKNPYLPTSGNIIQVNEYNQFGLDHPELFCYTPSNELVTDVENVQVEGPVTQWNGVDGHFSDWDFDNKLPYKYRNGWVTRQVYITVPPTEKTTYTIDGKPCTEQQYHDTDWASKFIDVGHAEKHVTPLPEAHPLEGVKTAALKHFATDQTSRYQDDTFVKGAEFGANWQKQQQPATPPASKELKSAEEIAFMFNPTKVELSIGNLYSLDTVKKIATTFHAQFAPDTRHHLTDEELLKAMQEYHRGQLVTDAGGWNPIRLRNLSMEKQYWLNISNGIKHNNTVIVDTFFADNDAIGADFFHSKDTNIKRLSSNATELFLRMVRTGFKVIFLDDSAKLVVQKLSPPIYDKHYANALTAPSNNSISEMVEENNFTQGYVCAVANLLRERDQPTVAQGLLESLGKISVYRLKKLGVDEQDISVLKKHKLII